MIDLDPVSLNVQLQLETLLSSERSATLATLAN